MIFSLQFVAWGKKPTKFHPWKFQLQSNVSIYILFINVCNNSCKTDMINRVVFVLQPSSIRHKDPRSMNPFIVCCIHIKFQSYDVCMSVFVTWYKMHICSTLYELQILHDLNKSYCFLNKRFILIGSGQNIWLGHISY